MSKKIFISLIISVLLGFLSAQIVYSKYRDNLEKAKYNAFLIQIGSYKNKELIEPAFATNNYLVLEEENNYNVYVGITTDLSNANKIKEIYDKKEIDTYIKPTTIDNVEFVSNLEQYDILLKEVEDSDNILSINEVILSTYEETVLGK